MLEQTALTLILYGKAGEDRKIELRPIPCGFVQGWDANEKYGV